jgi:hypothetical protein
MFHSKHVEPFTGKKNTVQKSVILLEHFKKLIHDALTDEQEII